MTAKDVQASYNKIIFPDLYKVLSVDRNPSNYSRSSDRVLDELYAKQRRATDSEARTHYIRQCANRLLDEEAHDIMTLQWQRIIPQSAQVKGWQITPSHDRHQQRDTVWLAA